MCSLFDMSNALNPPTPTEICPLTFPCFFSWLFAELQYPLVPASPVKWGLFPSVRQKQRREVNAFTMIQ